MYQKKLVFMGSKPIGFQCLQYLLENAKALNIEVVGVLTNTKHILNANEHDIVALCQKYSIKIVPSLSAFLKIEKVDIVISVQYHQILKQRHINKAQQIAVNLHIAPLPEYRGCNQFSFAILDNAKIFGTTIHKMETKIDAGDILFESRFAIPENCMVSELYALSLAKTLLLFKKHLADIVNGNYVGVPQAAFLGKRSSSFHKRSDIQDIKKIDLSWPKERIERHFRATFFPPFEPPYALVDGKKVYLSLEFDF
ncbi:MAG: formyltransferase family protein [Chitinophagales bacterium]